jgi:2-succinyl-5-enolpyruvyl-6-hydroxy-3-cyclohexene-1-carboxylate synthase
MFSDKQNINILTSLLIAHGIENAVVCPGSRNAPIVHNINECGKIKCWSVTDERSAGFYAIGMAQATQSPVVVCVTSGSALLNLAPAVAEAHYQHIPLIVVSADRPQQWIDQLDGQTLPQPNALQPFVRKAVSLPEPHDEETRWF